VLSPKKGHEDQSDKMVSRAGGGRAENCTLGEREIRHGSGWKRWMRKGAASFGENLL